MQSKQTIATIFHRFFELLPIFQKRKNNLPVFICE